MYVKNMFGRVVDVPLSHAEGVLTQYGMRVVSLDDVVIDNPTFKQDNIDHAKILELTLALNTDFIRDSEYLGISNDVAVDYDSMSYAELKKIAKEKGIVNVNIKRHELIALIK